MIESGQQIGPTIRRLRREQNLTQTQLGADQYSKSYVSALECGKIAPSPRALKFFAAQLELPEDYLTELAEQAADLHALALSDNRQAAIHENEHIPSDDEWRVLDSLLGRSNRYSAQALRELPALSLERVGAAPSSRQAGYAFLLGLSAQKKEEYETSVRALEYALALAPSPQQPAVLDALGRTYALQHAPVTALQYHLRAYHLIKSADSDSDAFPSSLLLDVAFHCGDDYRSLGDYEQASAMYEEARTLLTAEHDMQTAATLYLGLGYCLYGLVSYRALPAQAQQRRVLEQEREQLLQRAIGLLVQSRSVAQVSGDRWGAITAQLTLMLVELGLGLELHRSISRPGSTGELLAARCSSLLEDVEEQCRQVLLHQQEESILPGVAPDQRGSALDVALASLVRVHIQRAGLARLSNQAETALRERMLASSLCQEALANVGKPPLSSERISQLLALHSDPRVSRDPSLPRMPALRLDSLASDGNPLGRVEIYLAAAEVAEELGRAAVDQNYAHDCFSRADAFYLAALEQALPVVTRRVQDAGYLIRCYQRCVASIEERARADSEREEDIATTLLNLHKTHLAQLPGLLVPLEVSV